MSEVEQKKQLIHLPLPGSLLYEVYHGPDRGKKHMKRFKKANKLVVPLYRSRILPLLGAGKFFLLLIARGRKTGKIRRTPVEYFKHEGNIYIFSGRGVKSHWYKNIIANPNDVRIQLGFRTRKVKPVVVTDPERKKDIFKAYLLRRGEAAKRFFGWDPKQHDIDDVDFTELIEKVPIIQLEEPDEV